MAEQGAKTLHDGKSESLPTAAFARRIIQLMEFLENGLQLFVRDARAGVPHLDAQPAIVAATTEKYPPLLGVLECIGKQVAKHLFKRESL